MYPATFLTRTPSPFSVGWRWGAAIEKIFFIFSDSLSYPYWLLLWFSFYTRLITIWDLLHIVENNSFDTISRFNIPILYFDSFLLVKYYSHQFRLVSALSILCFDSSTLYLFNSSACYKQTSMLIWVCFMLILAILRLSDVFSFVLGVVYRLGLK